MKILRWLALVGIIAYQPVHTSLEEMAAGFSRAPINFGGNCDPISEDC